jgi:thioredoxin-like negative regulator of GroEL
MVRAVTRTLILAGFVVGSAAGSEVEKPPKPEKKANAGNQESPGRDNAIAWEKTLEGALEVARKGGKPLLIDFEAEWCGFCKKLDRETYTDEQVIRLVREYFVAVKVDVDKEPELEKKFNIQGLPTLVFLSPSGDEIARIEGFRPPELFVKDARKLVESSASLAKLKDLAEKDPKDPQAQRAYARALSAGGNFEPAIKTLRAALAIAPREAEGGLSLDLADALRASGKGGEAREAYERALAAEPRLADEDRLKAFLPLAQVLLSLQKPAEAVKVLSGYLEEKTLASADRIEALFWRSLAHAMEKSSEKALADLKAARDADPSGRWGLSASRIIEAVEAK